MSYSVYIRPLVPEDALVSYQWRNNPRLWRFTGSRPDRQITPEMERAWLVEALKRENEKRYAICLRADDTYIGNVFLTDIRGGEAQIHIFIGNMDYWGKGRACEAILLIMDVGFTELQLDTMYALINSKNASVIALGNWLGYLKNPLYYDSDKEIMLERVFFTSKMYEQKVHLNYNRKNKAANEASGIDT